MKVPKAKKLPSGSWRIQLRLGGESHSITEPTEKLCVQKAQIMKAEYLAGKKVQKIDDANLTLSRAIEIYCEDRSNGLSPSTIRKYYGIKKNHFQSLMNQRLDRIASRQWQCAVNEMLGRYAPITVDRSVDMVKTVVTANGVDFPPVSIGNASRQKAMNADKCKFLEPEQIPLFVAAAATTEYAIPLLLALSSLRIAEIDGLDWKDVTENTVKIRRVRIKDKDNNWVLKEGAKNETSVRDVVILIPELQKAVDAVRKPEGKLMTCCQEALRRAGKRVCDTAGIPFPGIHGLRHTFASLSAHLGIPEIVSQEIGGWANDKIMKEIYTHVARSDVTASLEKIKTFYAHKNSHAAEKSLENKGT